MKYSPTMMHAVSDYLMGALLMVAPWMFGFSHDFNATSCTMAFGVGMTLYSLFTDYELSVKRVIPMTAHLTLDAAAGGLLMAAPFLKGYANTVWLPHAIIGGIEMAMAVGFAFYLGFFRLSGELRTERGRHLAH